MPESSDWPVWLDFLTTIITVIALSAIFSIWLFFGRGRRAEQPPEELELPVDDGTTVRMVHNWQLLAIGIVGVAISWGFGSLAFFADTEDGQGLEIYGAIFFLFGFLSVFLIADYFRARHVLSATGLQYRKLFGGDGKLVWSEITTVRYGSFSYWFKLTDHTGDTIRISVISSNSVKFAGRVLRNVESSRMDARAERMLERVAGGTPPSIWRPY